MTATKEMLVLEQELQNYKIALGKAIDTILDNDISEFPIMVLHQHETEIGIPIIDKERVKGNWSVNASSLEDFVAKQIITEDKVSSFKEVYKDPKEFVCLFVLSELGVQFIFIPRVIPS